MLWVLKLYGIDTFFCYRKELQYSIIISINHISLSQENLLFLMRWRKHHGNFACFSFKSKIMSVSTELMINKFCMDLMREIYDMEIYQHQFWYALVPLWSDISFLIIFNIFFPGWRWETKTIFLSHSCSPAKFMHTSQIFISFAIFFLKLFHSCMTLSSLSFYSRSRSSFVVGAYNSAHTTKYWDKDGKCFCVLKKWSTLRRKTRKYLWKSRAWTSMTEERDFMPAHSVLSQWVFKSFNQPTPFSSISDHQVLILLKNNRSAWAGWYGYCFLESQIMSLACCFQAFLLPLVLYVIILSPHNFKN